MRSVPILLALSLATAYADPARDAETYAGAIERINSDHAKRPGTAAESALGDKLSRSARSAFERVLGDDGDGAGEALLRCGEAALDLALVDDFKAVRKRLQELAPEKVDGELGDAIVRERFVLRALDGSFAHGYLEEFGDLLDGVLDAYEEVFGFEEWSKVPGKKFRVRLHLVERITKPPHFAPQFPYHSEIDMPVVNTEAFRSPTPKGQFMFYGLCHELGHLVAMWGDRRTQEDHHAWAHYTGVAIVEHMAGDPKYKELLASRRDVRWKSLKIEREKAGEPSAKDRAGVLAMLVALHDAVGPKAIGAALNQMDEKDAGHRINHVRYYGFDDLKKALGAVVDDREKIERVKEIMP